MRSQKPAQRFIAASQAAVADSSLRGKIENATGRHLEQLALTRAAFAPFEAEREAARHIKHDAIGRLDELLFELRTRLEKNGCKVFFAATAAQARQYVAGVARAAGAKRVVKGKSMTAEEVGLNAALEGVGAQVFETDLGEFIVQLRGEHPSHILTPAIHLSRQDVGALFHEKLGVPQSDDPQVLTAAARDHLRNVFLSADMGITGVNFAVAETGTLVVVENEGNGRLAHTMPPIYVALMGIEKVIPKLGDLSHFLEVLARTATGQKLTAYTSFISGPRRQDEADGPQEMHVVILDNGRGAMLADPVLREALYCIRCGACLNVCPVYRQIGGHAYGSVYPGPIGAVVSPAIFGPSAAHLPFASTLCGACREVCPVQIDIPRLLLHLRWSAAQAPEALEWPRPWRRVTRGIARFSRLARHPRLARLTGRILRTLCRPFARDGYLRRMPPPFSGWTRFRDFPAPGGRPHQTGSDPK